jgi:hypothetical protein
MPLRDHFHPPLGERRHWDSFLVAWLEAMALALNQRLLPEEYFAETQVEREASPDHSPALLHFTASDLFEVQILHGSQRPRLVAAVELVSPANKDRPGHRHAFAVKCASYLQQQIGLVVVDVVTERHASLHRELLQLLRVTAATPGQEDGDLYAAAYRTVAATESLDLESWVELLAVGAALPTLPLWLAPDLCVPLDLEATCQTACAARRIA